jgi:N-acetylmuramoyl-L-alanine amidase
MMTALLSMASARSQTICIDPGHPSEVGRGTAGKHVTEIQIAWQIAKRLERKLASAGYKVVLTKRSEQEFVRNRRRAETANSAGAALMVRLHCDASSGTGFTVYYPDRQGKSQGKTGPSKEVLQASAVAARAMFKAMAAELTPSLSAIGCEPDIRTHVGKGQGALTGSIFSKVPILLVEMCVLTNPKDEAFLSSGLGQARMTNALFRGIQAYVPRRRS